MSCFNAYWWRLQWDVKWMRGGLNKFCTSSYSFLSIFKFLDVCFLWVLGWYFFFSIFSLSYFIIVICGFFYAQIKNSIQFKKMWNALLFSCKSTFTCRKNTRTEWTQCLREPLGSCTSAGRSAPVWSLEQGIWHAQWIMGKLREALWAIHERLGWREEHYCRLKIYSFVSPSLSHTAITLSLRVGLNPKI